MFDSQKFFITQELWVRLHFFSMKHPRLSPCEMFLYLNFLSVCCLLTVSIHFVSNFYWVGTHFYHIYAMNIFMGVIGFRARVFDELFEIIEAHLVWFPSCGSLFLFLNKPRCNPLFFDVAWFNYILLTLFIWLIRSFVALTWLPLIDWFSSIFRS